MGVDLLMALTVYEVEVHLNIRQLIAKHYLLPGLRYGCELFAYCDSVSNEKLNVLLNNIVRFVYGLRRYDHVTRRLTIF